MEVGQGPNVGCSTKGKKKENVYSGGLMWHKYAKVITDSTGNPYMYKIINLYAANFSNIFVDSFS
jgi:hypothetical protein